MPTRDAYRAQVDLLISCLPAVGHPRALTSKNSNVCVGTLQVARFLIPRHIYGADHKTTP